MIPRLSPTGAELTLERFTLDPGPALIAATATGVLAELDNLTFTDNGDQLVHISGQLSMTTAGGSINTIQLVAITAAGDVIVAAIPYEPSYTGAASFALYPGFWGIVPSGATKLELRGTISGNDMTPATSQLELTVLKL